MSAIKISNHSELADLIERLHSNDASIAWVEITCELLPEQVEQLSEALKVNTTLQDLSFIGNDIGDEGAQCLAEALKINRTLEDLGLSRNNIGDEGARYLAGALMVNTTLQEIRLYYNNIGALGGQYLAEAMKANTTLEYFILHDCAIEDAEAQVIEAELEKNLELSKAVAMLNRRIKADEPTNRANLPIRLVGQVEELHGAFLAGVNQNIARMLGKERLLKLAEAIKIEAEHAEVGSRILGASNTTTQGHGR